ncbi:sigma-70 family RNA polymerase sigma factor [Prolixibacteraceae bacterium Z1-6]|uniref:Sigma-70 family RNA polymerase sigma factor n=1 Tax=Draconibacterium aestuarii TaxID=2998507 RepID=A0A9X3J815_9BACT|nr:sigma-70 family RNA polymerase sigma factor [Prolixibacteraceae bacterium Z1-6]
MRSTEKEYWYLVWDKFKNGDSEAFKTIYNEFTDALFAYGSKITSNRDLLKDSIQDLFIDVYTYGSKLRQPELLEFYLFKTLKRIIIKKLKEDQRFSAMNEDFERFDLKFTIEDEVFGKDSEKKLKLLQKEISQLAPASRELLFLKFNSGLSYEAIAKIVGIKPDSAKKQIYRIVQRLRKDMDSKNLELFMMCFTA